MKASSQNGLKVRTQLKAGGAYYCSNGQMCMIYQGQEYCWDSASCAPPAPPAAPPCYEDAQCPTYKDLGWCSYVPSFMDCHCSCP